MSTYAKIACFDIDGTIANIEHRRHWVSSKPKNWPAFNAGMVNDTPHDDIVEMMDILASQDFIIVLCSGRNEDTREVTESWLTSNDIPYARLYMRAEKDYRSDDIVKVELLNRIRQDYGEPRFWFDDRNQVVNAIRAEGVRVFQVAPGDF